MGQAPTATQVAGLLAAVGVIAFAALAVGVVARRLHQPVVIGEMLLGVLAGPTVLHGALGHAVIAPDVRPLLGGLANLGLALFMFLVGLELEPAAPRGAGPGDAGGRGADTAAVATVAVGAVTLPALLGGALGLQLAGRLAGAQRISFVIFIATAMSVTAFPVLARILRDRGREGSTVGQLALRSAAVSDLIAWLLLAVALLVGRTHGGPGWRAATVVPYAGAMLILVRPALRRLEARASDRRQLQAAVLAGALCSGALTSWMGLHPAFGAFLFGAIVPRHAGGRLRTELQGTLGALV
ncbi:MAG: cation:proton antiporter, partial [Solirubrobacteraceae bacterium]